MRLLSLLLLTTLSLSAADRPASALFKEIFEEQLRDDPESATSVGRHDYDNRWTDWSKAGRDLRRTHLERSLEQLNRLPTASLSAQDRLTVRLLQYDSRGALETDDINTHLLRIRQLGGLHNAVYFLIDLMPARTVRDYENIVARLRATPAYVDQHLELLDESIARGITQPRDVVDRVATQIEAQMQQDRDGTPLLAAFRRFPSNIPQAEQNRLRAAAVEAYEKQFLPAWRKLHAYVTGKYAANARAAVGLGSIPGGSEFYASLVRRRTTTSMTPVEIHQLGLKEVARIEAAMQAVAKETGFNGTLPEFERHIATLPEQHFRTKEEMLVYCRNIAKIIEPELPRLFRHIPVLLYGVRAIPPDREASSATGAQAPSPDYSTPGWFNLNTYQPEKQVKYDMESLVLHEAVPGHIFQITLAQGLEGLPELRRFYSNGAYVEGWALYTESLGSQLDLYHDPYSRFGQLSSERFRAVRLVVDTGLHALGWTRQQAVDYFHEHAPMESLAEVDRYIAWPAQALSYKIGELKIRQLRALAEQSLGEKFDIRDFHDLILRDGPLPLDLLEEQVQAYIRAASAQRKAR